MRFKSLTLNQKVSGIVWCGNILSISHNKKFKILNSTGKLMMMRFWDMEGPLYIHFSHQNGTTIVTTTVSCGNCWSQNQNQTTSKLSKDVILLHDNPLPHMANKTTLCLQYLGSELLVHSPYSPNLLGKNVCLKKRSQTWCELVASETSRNEFKSSLRDRLKYLDIEELCMKITHFIRVSANKNIYLFF